MSINQQGLEAITKLKPSPVTQEYYLTKVVSKDLPFDIMVHNERELQGINTFEEFIHIESLAHQLTYQSLLQKNTSISDYNSLTFLNTLIGHHCHLGSHTTLKNSSIGNHCQIGQGSILNNVILHDHVTILPYSILSDCEIESYSSIGPFAHIQENTKIGQNSTIGNFVEIKRSLIANNVKAKHLTYLGDAYIDHHANIGAGTITCNYVPWKKQKSLTYIGSYSLIGANSLLIAPCHIGPYTILAAGSTIQGYILPKQLAISRAPLTIRHTSRLYELVE